MRAGGRGGADAVAGAEELRVSNLSVDVGMVPPTPVPTSSQVVQVVWCGQGCGDAVRIAQSLYATQLDASCSSRCWEIPLHTSGWRVA